MQDTIPGSEVSSIERYCYVGHTILGSEVSSIERYFYAGHYPREWGVLNREVLLCRTLSQGVGCPR